MSAKKRLKKTMRQSKHSVKSKSAGQYMTGKGGLSSGRAGDNAHSFEGMKMYKRMKAKK